MKDWIDQPFHSLSTGMKQKLAIARSLLNSFEILFLDEPTRSLDTSISIKLRKFLKKMAEEQGKTIFYITHNLEEAKEISTCIGIMNKGKVEVFRN
jgi:ABC-type multidrug transport system ATPase subunit